MSDVCSDFVEQIHQQFGFLFGEKGFRVVHADQAGGEHCLLVLDSGRFRIKLTRAPDEIHVLLGGPTAPLVWEENVEGQTHWYHLHLVVAYLSGSLDVHIPDPEAWAERTIERQMGRLSGMLLDHYGEVEDLFGKGKFELVKTDYELFVEALEAAAMRQYMASSSPSQAEDTKSGS